MPFIKILWKDHQSRITTGVQYIFKTLWIFKCFIFIFNFFLFWNLIKLIISLFLLIKKKINIFFFIIWINYGYN